MVIEDTTKLTVIERIMELKALDAIPFEDRSEAIWDRIAENRAILKDSKQNGRLEYMKAHTAEIVEKQKQSQGSRPRQNWEDKINKELDEIPQQNFSRCSTQKRIPALL